MGNSTEELAHALEIMYYDDIVDAYADLLEAAAARLRELGAIERDYVPHEQRLADISGAVDAAVQLHKLRIAELEAELRAIPEEVRDYWISQDALIRSKGLHRHE